MFELFLSKTPNKEASPAVARKPRHPAKKFSSQFLICARRFFSSKRKRKLLCGVLLLTRRTGGGGRLFFFFVRGSALNEQDGGAVRFLYSLGRGGIPPKPPFRHALAGTILFFGGI